MREFKKGLPYSKFATGHAFSFDDFDMVCEFARKANEYQNARIFIERGCNGGKKADAKLAMDISQLHIQKGETVTITATGFEKTDAVNALCALIRAYDEKR